MLSLNSYGLSSPTPAQTRAAHKPSSQQIHLPRLSLPENGHAPRAPHSLSKIEMLRKPGNPFYRTTTGFEYGRYLDIRDVALSCPKHARPSGFTKDFITGMYEDTSLTSIDKSKQRAESWQRKVELRTEQMRIRCNELQKRADAEKLLRREARDQRRMVMKKRHQSASAIQALVRGRKTRQRLRHERYVLETDAAIRIQYTARRHLQVVRAKAVLEHKKMERLVQTAHILQQVGKKYILRMRAKRELHYRRKLRQAQIEREELEKAERQRHDAAVQIQQIARGYVCRKVHRPVQDANKHSAVGSHRMQRQVRRATASMRIHRTNKSRSRRNER